MASPVIVQTNIGSSFPLSSLAFTSNVAAGNLIVVCFGNRNLAIASQTFTDSQGNSYTNRAQAGATSLNASIWTAVAGSTGACTVTFADGNTTAVILEVSGAAASFVDQAANADGNDNAPVVPLANTTNADDLILGFFRTSNTAQTITATNGFATERERESDECASCESRTVSATGDYDPTWTTTNTPFWSAVGIAIKGASTDLTWLPILVVAAGPAFRMVPTGAS